MRDRAIFFDRDGTIIVEKDFISDPDEVELIPGATEALLLAANLGFKLFIVSNQSGVARGIMTQDQVEKVNLRLTNLLAVSKVKLDGIYFCPHHPEVSGSCDCRKPNRGMIDQALRKFSLDLTDSYVIGDRKLDIELGRNIGSRAVLVLTGYGAIEMNDFDPGQPPDYIAKDVFAAMKWIRSHESL